MNQTANTETAPAPGSVYEPLGMWRYIGYTIVLMIPIVGLVLAVIWSFGGGNANRKGLARAHLLFKVIFLVIIALLIIIAVVFGEAIQEAAMNAMGLGGITGLPGGGAVPPGYEGFANQEALDELIRMFSQGGYFQP